jgi:hypothetical protein
MIRNLQVSKLLKIAAGLEHEGHKGTRRTQKGTLRVRRALSAAKGGCVLRAPKLFHLQSASI